MKNTSDPGLDDADVGEPVDPLAAKIARGEPVGWGGPRWRRIRRRSMKVVAWVGLALIGLSLVLAVYAIVVQLRG